MMDVLVDMASCSDIVLKNSAQYRCCIRNLYMHKASTGFRSICMHNEHKKYTKTLTVKHVFYIKQLIKCPVTYLILKEFLYYSLKCITIKNRST